MESISNMPKLKLTGVITVGFLTRGKYPLGYWYCLIVNFFLAFMLIGFLIVGLVVSFRR